MVPIQFHVFCGLCPTLEIVFEISSISRFHIFPASYVIYFTSDILTLSHRVNTIVYTFRFNKASVVVILHSKRTPFFLCIGSSYLYLASHWGHHYVLPVICIHRLPLFESLSPFVYWYIDTSMGMPSLSIYMCNIICTSSIFWESNTNQNPLQFKCGSFDSSTVLSNFSSVVTISPLILWCLYLFEK